MSSYAVGRGSCAAACGARAADEAADHWIACGATASSRAKWTAAFVERLREVGWVEGQTVAIVYRCGGTLRASRHHRRVRPAQGRCHCHACDPNVVAAKQVTSVIRSCSLGGGPGWHWARRRPCAPGRQRHRPVGPVSRAGWKASRAATRAPPESRPLAILDHIGNPVTARQIDAVKAAAGIFGLDVAIAEIRRAEDIAPAIEALEGRADALIVPSGPLYNTNRVQISSWALRVRLPTIHFDGSPSKRGA